MAFKNLLDTIAFYLGGKTKSEIIATLAHITKLPSDAMYYKRTDWNEHDAGDMRMSENTKAMFCALTPVATIGAHTFYADRRLAQKKTATP